MKYTGSSRVLIVPHTLNINRLHVDGYHSIFVDRVKGAFFSNGLFSIPVIFVCKLRFVNLRLL